MLFIRLKLSLAAFAVMLVVARAAEVNDTVEQTVVGDPDVTITSSGGVNLYGTNSGNQIGVNITQSNGKALVEGSVQIRDTDSAGAAASSNGAVGISLTSGGTRQGALIELRGAGSISISEAVNARGTPDANNVLNGPFAAGSGRHGILVDTSAAIGGDIRLGATTRIAVTGQDSAGLKLTGAGTMSGDVFASGSIFLTGEGSTANQQAALWLDKALTGSLLQKGTITASGEHGIGILVQQPISGAIQLGGAISATGYGYTNFSNYRRTDDILGAANLKQGGSAVRITSGVGKGVLVDGAVQKFITPADTTRRTDKTKVRVDDYDENRTRGILTSRGSAPALAIDGNVTLGAVVETLFDTRDDDSDDDRIEELANFTYSHGLINRGQISGIGLNNEVAAVGAKLSRGVVVSGGILNSGTISASANNAAASGLWLDNTVSLGGGGLANEGVIEAQVNTQTNDAAHLARAVRIGGSEAALRFVNRGQVVARVRYDGDTPTQADLTSAAQKALAFDFSARSAGGVELVQEFITANSQRDSDIAYAVEAGNSTHESLDRNNDGMIDPQDTSTVQIIGNINMTAQADTARFNAGTVQGDIDFGAGNDSLNLANAAQFSGRVKSSGGLNINLANTARLNLNAQTADDISGNLTLALSNQARLRITAEGGNTTPILTTQSLTLNGNDVSITPALQTASVGDANGVTRLLLLRNTTSLSGRDFNALLGDEVAFIYDVKLALQNNSRDLAAIFTVKTPQALGLNKTQAQAQRAVLGLAAQSGGAVSNAIINPSTQTDFITAYRQILPAYGDGNMLLLSDLHHGLSGALAQQLAFAEIGGRQPGEIWAQQFGKIYHQDARANTEKIDSSYYAMGFGYDYRLQSGSLLGVTGVLGFTIVDEHVGRVLRQTGDYASLGVYVAQPIGAFDAIVTAGLGRASFTGARDITLTGLTDRLSANWDGDSFSAGAKLRYQQSFGRFDIKAEIGADRFELRQAAHDESSAQNRGLAIAKGAATSSIYGTGFLLEAGWRFQGNGRGAAGDFIWHPKLAIGTRGFDDYTPYMSKARFIANSDEAFTLRTHDAPDDRLLSQFILSVNNDYFALDFRLEFEKGDTLRGTGGGMSARLRF